jgi:glycosyltransferase involved in cell wall biosynthesis
MSADLTGVVGFATQGTESHDEQRLRELLAGTAAEVWSLERHGRLRTALRLALRLARERPDLVVMEGTGVLGGCVLLASRLFGTRWVVSSGDAVGPFVAAMMPSLKWPAAVYERALCRCCAGYVGWTPYLTGRAITLGAPRAMTLPGWGPASVDHGRRAEIRSSWGVAPDDIVFGIVGSLQWNQRFGYCYGLELARAAARIQRNDVVAVIIGDGDGRPELAKEVARSGARVIVTGPVPRTQVPAMLAAMDIGSLPQSVDRVGMFRYSTKLPEYLAAGLPIVAGELPMAYDLDDGWLIRLPGAAPWDPRYVAALARTMQEITWERVRALRAAVPRDMPTFDRVAQRRRFHAFLAESMPTREARPASGGRRRRRVA